MKNLKRSVITRGVQHVDINTEDNLKHRPQLGDVAVFEVVSIGKHTAIQGIDETLTKIFPGDHLLMAFGGRYASNQFEGYIPDEPTTDLQILGQGGTVGELASSHARFQRTGATQVKLVGYAVDINNNIINTRYARLDKVKFSTLGAMDYDVYLSVGAGMDSGKTATAAAFARGAALEGKRVAYIKLTGTVHSKDRRMVRDSGAEIAVDFSHCGYPSTYMCSTEEILDIYATLLKRVESINPDLVVVEIADGLLQKETHDLLGYRPFMRTVSGVILSCPDSLSVYGGMQVLESLNLRPVIVSGIFTASPLMITEVATFTDIMIFSLSDFTQQGQLLNVLERHNRVAKRLHYFRRYMNSEMRHIQNEANKIRCVA